jgi:23S rRNA (adenine2030-N6)-methyltransferase
MVWYPLLQRPEPEEMIEHLRTLGTDNWLNVTLSVEKPAADGYGMFGSGMYIVNPPWTLPDTLKIIMPELTRLLALDEQAHYTLDYEIA